MITLEIESAIYIFFTISIAIILLYVIRDFIVDREVNIPLVLICSVILFLASHYFIFDRVYEKVLATSGFNQNFYAYSYQIAIEKENLTEPLKELKNQFYEETEETQKIILAQIDNIDPEMVNIAVKSGWQYGEDRSIRAVAYNVLKQSYFLPLLIPVFIIGFISFAFLSIARFRENEISKHNIKKAELESECDELRKQIDKRETILTELENEYNRLDKIVEKKRVQSKFYEDNAGAGAELEKKLDDLMKEVAKQLERLAKIKEEIKENQAILDEINETKTKEQEQQNAAAEWEQRKARQEELKAKRKRNQYDLGR